MKGVKIVKNELDTINPMQNLANIEYYPAMQDINLPMEKTTKIPLSQINNLGVAFQPLTTVIQTAINGTGGSGLYFVNTHGKAMFQKSGSSEFIGSLKSASGQVGGGQATMTTLACDPTMLFMAMALMNIEKKLDKIQEIQQELLEFLEIKETAKLKGNLNTLTDILNNYKFNWNNEKYKTNKHILVQDIRKESEQNILLYRDLIAKKHIMPPLLHSDQEVGRKLKKLESLFKDYQLALYLYAFSTFLEVLLLENFDPQYLNSTSRRIEEYSLKYRELYTQTYNLLEHSSNTSIQSGLLSGISATSKIMGKAIAKVPVISKSQIDENLIEAGKKLELHTSNRTIKTLDKFVDVQNTVVTPFIENIKTINILHNTATEYLFDKENLYICQNTK